MDMCKLFCLSAFIMCIILDLYMGMGWNNILKSRETAGLGWAGPGRLSPFCRLKSERRKSR